MFKIVKNCPCVAPCRCAREDPSVVCVQLPHDLGKVGSLKQEQEQQQQQRRRRSTVVGGGEQNRHRERERESCSGGCAAVERGEESVGG